MPTYTYRCSNCGVEFDKFQKFSDKPLTRCPECRTGRVSRIPQASAIVFKGSGWYATDHKSLSGKSGKKSEGEAGKTESKPDKPEKKEEKAAASDD